MCFHKTGSDKLLDKAKSSRLSLVHSIVLFTLTQRKTMAHVRNRKILVQTSARSILEFCLRGSNRKYVLFVGIVCGQK